MREVRGSNNITWYEIVNSKNVVHNYSQSWVDVNSDSIEIIVKDLLWRLQHDVMHIHEIIGLPSSIIDDARGTPLASDLNESTESKDSAVY